MEDLRADLKAVPGLCGLKVRAIELVLERGRQAGGATDSELDPAVGALLSEARSFPGCKLWMLERDLADRPEEDLEQLAGCYRNVIEAARQALAFEAEQGLEAAPPRKLMSLMAEAQSALYAVLRKFAVETDRCQLEMFAWLRERTDVFRIYIPKYMDRQTLASPKAYRSLAKRLAELS